MVTNRDMLGHIRSALVSRADDLEAVAKEEVLRDKLGHLGPLIFG